MNILFFMIPKISVTYAESSFTLRQVSEKMMAHNLTAIPIIDEEGRYVSVISEGDLFRYIKQSASLNYSSAEETPISSIPRQREINAISYAASMNDLIDLAVNQNFVPVVDDRGIFIGIVTRKAIIRYLKEELRGKEEGQ